MFLFVGIAADPVSRNTRQSQAGPSDTPPPDYETAMRDANRSTAGFTYGSSHRPATTAVASKAGDSIRPASAPGGKASHHPVSTEPKRPSWDTDMRSAIETWIHEKKEFIRLKPKRGSSSCSEIQAGTSLDPEMIARKHERAAEDIHKVMRHRFRIAMMAGCDDKPAKVIIGEAAGAWWAREEISPLWDTVRREFEREQAGGGCE